MSITTPEDETHALLR